MSDDGSATAAKTKQKKENDDGNYFDVRIKAH
jgi:hypothetical protein